MMPKPAVAGILSAHYIEARQHTDHPDGKLQAHNIELQKEMQGYRSLPYYMLIHPKTGEVFGTQAGLALSTQTFIDFLESGIKRSGIKEVALAD